MTLDEIVKDYIRTQRPHTGQDMIDFANESSCRLNNLLYAAFLTNQCVSLWFFQTRDYKTVELTLRGAFGLTWNRV